MNQQEELLGWGGRDGRGEGSSAIGDGGQAAISLVPDIDGTGSSSLLEPDAHSHFWKFTAWEFVCRGLNYT